MMEHDDYYRNISIPSRKKLKIKPKIKVVPKDIVTIREAIKSKKREDSDSIARFAKIRIIDKKIISIYEDIRSLLKKLRREMNGLSIKEKKIRVKENIFAEK